MRTTDEESKAIRRRQNALHWARQPLGEWLYWELQW